MAGRVCFAVLVTWASDRVDRKFCRDGNLVAFAWRFYGTVVWFGEFVVFAGDHNMRLVRGG